MRVLGIIPARGGSKGVLRKNIRSVNGKPLIYYSIKTAFESNLLTDFYVSTDDEEIKNISESFNAKVLMRKPDLAEDNSSIDSVLFDVLQNLKKEYDILILLQPTAPIRTGVDVDNIIKMFIEDDKVDSVVSVIELKDIHPARMYQVDLNNDLISLDAKNENIRRQDLDKIYLRNGCFYAAKVASFLKEKRIIMQHKKAYIMEEEKWANIDDERDLLIAETLIKYFNIYP